MNIIFILSYHVSTPSYHVCILFYCAWILSCSLSCKNNVAGTVHTKCLHLKQENENLWNWMANSNKIFNRKQYITGKWFNDTWMKFFKGYFKFLVVLYDCISYQVLVLQIQAISLPWSVLCHAFYTIKTYDKIPLTCSI